MHASVRVGPIDHQADYEGRFAFGIGPIRKVTRPIMLFHLWEYFFDCIWPFQRRMKGKFFDINIHEIGGCKYIYCQKNRNLEVPIYE